MDFHHSGNLTGFANKHIKVCELQQELDRFKYQLKHATSVSIQATLNSKSSKHFTSFINQFKSKLKQEIELTLSSKIDDNLKDIKMTMIIIYDRFDFKSDKKIKDTFDTTIMYKSNKMQVKITTLNEPKVVIAQASVDNIDEMTLCYNDEFFTDVKEFYKLDEEKIKDDILVYIANLILTNYYKPLVTKNGILLYSSENITLYEKIAIMQEKLIGLKV